MPQDVHKQDEIGAPEHPIRIHLNGHTLQMTNPGWHCLHCQHDFVSSAEAEAFWCGDPCRCHGPFS